jgi:hypothetical protein
VQEQLARLQQANEQPSQDVTVPKAAEAVVVASKVSQISATVAIAAHNACASVVIIGGRWAELVGEAESRAMTGRAL